jgi:hypothetical protein
MVFFVASADNAGGWRAGTLVSAASVGLVDGVDVGPAQGVTKTIATRYKRADETGKRRILGELCATTGWHRAHARKALKAAPSPRVVKQQVLWPHHVRIESCCGAVVLLGDIGYAPQVSGRRRS